MAEEGRIRSFADTHATDEVAPISAVRATVIKPPQFDDLRMSLKAIYLYAQAHEDRPSLRCGLSVT
jgi:hypothetical protein